MCTIWDNRAVQAFTAKMLRSGLLRLNVLRTTSSPSATNARNHLQFKVDSASYISSNFKRKSHLCTASDEKQTGEENMGNEDTFKHLLDNSQFVRSVDPVGQLADGEIIAVSKANIYVDFGSKFHGVVPLPKENSDRYVEGAKVTVLIKDLEMTDHFLGAKKHISLLEAETELIGLVSKPSS